MKTLFSIKRVISASLITVCTSLSLVSAANAIPTVIGFEDFGPVGVSGPTVTNQYPDVLFSSTGSNFNIVSTQPGIGAGDNFGSVTINC